MDQVTAWPGAWGWPHDLNVATTTLGDDMKEVTLFDSHQVNQKKISPHTHTLPISILKKHLSSKMFFISTVLYTKWNTMNSELFEVCLFFAGVGGLKAPRPHELPPLPSHASPSAKWHRPCHRQWNAPVLQHLKRLCIWIPQFHGILLPVKQKASRTWRPSLFSGG